MFSCLLLFYSGHGGEVDIMFPMSFCSRCCSPLRVQVRALRYSPLHADVAPCIVLVTATVLRTQTTVYWHKVIHQTLTSPPSFNNATTGHFNPRLELPVAFNTQPVLKCHMGYLRQACRQFASQFPKCEFQKKTIKSLLQISVTVLKKEGRKTPWEASVASDQWQTRYEIWL